MTELVHVDAGQVSGVAVDLDVSGEPIQLSQEPVIRPHRPNISPAIESHSVAHLKVLAVIIPGAARREGIAEFGIGHVQTLTQRR